MLGQFLVGTKLHHRPIGSIARRADLHLRGGLKRPHRDLEDLTDPSRDRAIPSQCDSDGRVRWRRTLEIEPRGLVAELDRELEVAPPCWNPFSDDPFFTAAFGADEAKRVVADLDTAQH